MVFYAWNRGVAWRECGCAIKWAEMKMPVQNKHRSDLGGGAHLTNIGPVPLSLYRSLPSLPWTESAF